MSAYNNKQSQPNKTITSWNHVIVAQVVPRTHVMTSCVISGHVRHVAHALWQRISPNRTNYDVNRYLLHWCVLLYRNDAVQLRLSTIILLYRYIFALLYFCNTVFLYCCIICIVVLCAHELIYWFVVKPILVYCCCIAMSLHCYNISHLHDNQFISFTALSRIAYNFFYCARTSCLWNALNRH